MERKPIKVGQLLAILNQRVMRYSETSRCKINSIAPVKTRDREQCNWSSTVNWSDNGQDRELAMPVIRRLVMNAQKEFNIMPIGMDSLS